MSSPASVAGALRQAGASLGPELSSSSLQRTGRAAPGRRWRHGPAQVAWPQHCCLPSRNLLWVCCKVQSNWCWCCRREVLRLPVANQPLARQRAHGVVSALGWNECHGYVPKCLAHLGIKCLHRGFAVSVAQRELGIIPHSSRITVWIFVCRKDRWELSSLAVCPAPRMYCTGVFELIALAVRLVMGRNECTHTKGCLGLPAQPSVQPSCGCEEQRTSHTW